MLNIMLTEESKLDNFKTKFISYLKLIIAHWTIITYRHLCGYDDPQLNKHWIGEISTFVLNIARQSLPNNNSDKRRKAMDEAIKESKMYDISTLENILKAKINEENTRARNANLPELPIDEKNITKSVSDFNINYTPFLELISAYDKNTTATIKNDIKGFFVKEGIPMNECISYEQMMSERKVERNKLLRKFNHLSSYSII